MPGLREALESAISESEPKNEVVPNQATEAPAEPDTSGNDIAAASSVENDESIQETAEVETVPKSDDEKEVAAKPVEDKPATQAKSSRVDRPPTNWKGGAKGEWANVPLAVRQEVHRIEAEVNKVMQEAAPAKQFVQQFQQVVAPYMARIESYGTPPVQAIGNLLKADYLLSSAPKVQRAQLMAQFIKDYEIDIVELDNALAGATSPNSQGQQSDVEERILQRVQQMVAPFQQQQQRLIQQEQSKAVGTVESMAQDHVKYPYFNEVRQDMADIVEMMAKRGVDISLEEAYARATRINPEVSSQMERTSLNRNAVQQHQQAQRARNASSSVTGAPAAGGTGTFAGGNDIRSHLEAAFNSARI